LRSEEAAKPKEVAKCDRSKARKVLEFPTQNARLLLVQSDFSCLPNHVFKPNIEDIRQPKQGIYRWSPLFMLDEAYGLPIESRTRRHEIE